MKWFLKFGTKFAFNETLLPPPPKSHLKIDGHSNVHSLDARLEQHTNVNNMLHRKITIFKDIAEENHSYTISKSRYILYLLSLLSCIVSS